MRGLVWASLLLVSLPHRGEGGDSSWYQDRPRLTIDYLHGPLADTISRYRLTIDYTCMGHWQTLSAGKVSPLTIPALTTGRHHQQVQAHH